MRDTIRLRVRYSETDQMGTFYNSRALDWFECGRSELMRRMGLPYSEMEDRGVFLPVIEAHIRYNGRARYDDLLEITTVASMVGRVKLRCDVEIVHAESRAKVVTGYTVHAFLGVSGRPVRPPEWFIKPFYENSNTE